jgi:hypothetical protein
MDEIKIIKSNPLGFPKPPKPEIRYETWNGKEYYWFFGKRRWKFHSEEKNSKQCKKNRTKKEVIKMEEIKFTGVDIVQELKDRFVNGKHKSMNGTSEEEKSAYRKAMNDSLEYIREIVNSSDSLVVHIENQTPAIDMNIEEVNDVYIDMMLSYTE